MFLDSDQIKENSEFDTLEYKENLDEFSIQLNYQLVKIHFGPGKIIVDKELFDRELEHYKKQCIETTARYHFDNLKKLAEGGDPTERSIAKACIKQIIKEAESK